MEIEIIKNSILEFKGFVSMCAFDESSAQAKASRKQVRKSF
jgi:hypothetical protein